MVLHMLKDRNIPVTNDEISNLYCETTLITANTEQWISPLGGDAPEFPSDQGELISLVSASASDVGVFIQVIGLSEDFMTLKEIVPLNGTTPVQTQNKFTRLNSLAVVGPTAVQGQVLAQNLAGTVTYRQVSVASQYSADGVASIPRNKTAEFEQLYFGITKDGGTPASAFCSLYVRLLGQTPFFNPLKVAASTGSTSFSMYDNPAPQSFHGPIDLYLTATASKNTVSVVSRFVTIELNK